MLTRGACAAALTAVALVGTETRVTSQSSHELSEVLRRAGAYVEAFQRQLSGIVAEETYLQEILPDASPRGRRLRAERRELRSDLLLLRPEGGRMWVQYRDVIAVDGRPVRDRHERLTTLLTRPGARDARRATQTRAESARYNLGPIRRTMNVPVLPLAVLAPHQQHRFRFASSEVDGVDISEPAASPLPSTPHFRVSVEGWVVTFQERQSPTLIQAFDGSAVFSRGRFWIERETGRVMMSELVARDKTVSGTLHVSYQSEPLLGFLVPTQLREEYTQTDYPATIVGEATYGNFRPLQLGP